MMHNCVVLTRMRGAILWGRLDILLHRVFAFDAS